MAKAFSISFPDLTACIADFKAAGGNAKNLVNAALVNSVGRTQAEMRVRAAHRTGTLQRGILTRVSYPVGTVRVTEKYGEYLEFGTGIFGPKGTKIVPKNGKALQMVIGGHTIYRKSSKGMKAQPFFAPGFKAAKPYIDEQFNQVLAILVRIMAGRK